MVCRGPERLYCRSREAPAGRDAPARRTAEAAHANRVPRPPRLRRRRRGSGPPVLSTPAASTIPRGRTLSARPRLHRRVRLLPAPLPYTPLTIPIEIPRLPMRALPLIARARGMASGGVHTVRDLARVSVGDGSRWPAVVTPSSAEADPLRTPSRPLPAVTSELADGCSSNLSTGNREVECILSKRRLDRRLGFLIFAAALPLIGVSCRLIAFASISGLMLLIAMTVRKTFSLTFDFFTKIGSGQT